MKDTTLKLGLLGNDNLPADSLPVIMEATNTIHPALDFQKDLGLVTVSIQVADGHGVKYVPLIVTSDRRAIPGNHSMLQCDHEQWLFSCPPPALRSLARWRVADINRFTAREELDSLAVFNGLLDIYNRYIDYPELGMLETVALWAAGTYVFPLFPAYPYLQVNGPPNSGKSKLLQLTELVAFNGRRFVDPTAATLYNLLATTRSTLCIDEADGKESRQTNALVQVLNAGYAVGGTVLRCAPGRHELVEHDVYSPKMFANVRGLEDTTASRCIPIQLLRTRDEERGRREVVGVNETCADIRHGLYSLALADFGIINRLYDGAVHARTFINRENQKWSPVFALAQYFQQRGAVGLVEKIAHFAESITQLAAECSLPAYDQAVALALDTITRLESPCDIRPGALLKRVRLETGERWRGESPESTGRALRRLGLRRNAHDRFGSSYHITRQQVADIANRYNVPIEAEEATDSVTPDTSVTTLPTAT